MANIATTFEIAQRICAAIGIETKLVRSIHIEIDACDVTRIKIERFVSEGEAEKIIQVFEAVEWKQS